MDDDDFGLGLLPEPERPKTPPPTTDVYETMSSDDVLKLRLVSKHPLYGHQIYPSARIVSRYMEERPELVRGKRVIEFGAGSGLPGIVAAHLGASDVNLEHNAEANFGPSGASTSSHRTPRDRVIVVPHTWGQPLPPEAQNIDVCLQCDLVFNVSAHEQLLDSTERALNDDGIALVFYAFHRAHKAAEDAKFIDRAQARGWQCEEVVTQWGGLAFPDDEGDLQLRGTVHGWLMKLPPRSQRRVLHVQ